MVRLDGRIVIRQITSYCEMSCTKIFADCIVSEVFSLLQTLNFSYGYIKFRPCSEGSDNFEDEQHRLEPSYSSTLGARLISAL
jgi:hypothetical protein